MAFGLRARRKEKVAVMCCILKPTELAQYNYFFQIEVKSQGELQRLSIIL